jgi:DNA-directed RNA polymerase sigma subunit (sigma70/sigma32)
MADDVTKSHYRLLYAIFGEKWNEEISLLEEESSDLVSNISSILDTLSNKEMKFVSLRFGLESGFPMSLDEIAGVLNSSLEEVGALELDVIEKLRHPSRSQSLRPFLRD